MAYTVTMPQMGYDMVDGTINQWLRQEGDTVTRGDIIASIATDKTDVDIEAYASGVIRRILVPAGGRVPVGTAIAVIAEPDEQLAEQAPAPAASPPAVAGSEAAPVSSAPAPAAPPPTVAGSEAAPVSSAPAPAAPPPAVAGSEAVPVPSAPAGAKPPPGAPGIPGPNGSPRSSGPAAGWGRVRASPLARRRARELGVDLAQLEGSGPAGRVTADDVERLSTAGVPRLTGFDRTAVPGEPDDPYQVVPLTRIREATARRMVEAKSTIPHFYLTTSVDMGACLRLRGELNQLPEATVPHISVTDFVLRAFSLTLQRHAALNAGWVGGELRRYARSNIALAVALPEGLVAPTLRDCDQVAFSELARRAHDLAARARANRLRPSEMSGAHAALSNLGMHQILDFSAIITPGQGSVLAVGATQQTPVVVEGAVAAGWRMSLTLAIDHRVTDGAQGAEALAHCGWLLEHPAALLV